MAVSSALHVGGMIFLLTATVLLVVVSVGLPVWDSVYFLQGDLRSIINRVGGNGGTELRMGQWGICVAGQCTDPKLGYDLSFITDSTSGNVHVAASVIHGLTYALILHPIAAVVTFIALLFSIGSHWIVGSLLASVAAFFAFLITLIALCIDLALFVTARHRLDNLVTGRLIQSVVHFDASYGPALWLVLVAAILQLLATFFVCFTHHSQRRVRAREISTTNGAEKGVAPTTGQSMGERRWFWQKRRGGELRLIEKSGGIGGDGGK